MTTLTKLPAKREKKHETMYAIVEWLSGPRNVAEFMRRAGLGISGMGMREQVTLTYTPGEKVTEERVLKAVNSMIADLNAEKADIEISAPRVVYIGTKNEEQAHD